MKLLARLSVAAPLALALLAFAAPPLAAQRRYSRITSGSIDVGLARGEFRYGEGHIVGDWFSLWYQNYEGSRTTHATKCSVVGCAPGETAQPPTFLSPANYDGRGGITLRRLPPVSYGRAITSGYFGVSAQPVTLPTELQTRVELTTPFSFAGRMWVEGQPTLGTPFVPVFDAFVYGEGVITMTFERGGELYFLTRYRFEFKTPQQKPVRTARPAAP